MIRFKDVSFTYGAKEGQLPIRAVDHLSFHVRKGSHVALLGRNGSGKSTIARLINGLLLPDEGSVLVDGMDTTDSLDIFEIRRICGMVFQNPDNQLIGTTVADDIAFGPCNLELSIDEVNSRVDEALRKAGLTELRDRAPHNLSGGQKQKLA
ncbi:MAG: ATP-binding cassette domain-containing protein, partial [Clostridiaceae bacterium]|nr:ATP-binding cassette domain-containing protein [Clostridiaceae bacterium]